MEIRIDIKDGLAGCAFYKNEALVEFGDLTSDEKKKAVETLANLCILFHKFI